MPTISGIASSLGAAAPLTALNEYEQVPSDVIAGLRARGLERFCIEERSTAAMCEDAIRKSLANTQISCIDIGAIIIGHSSSGWTLNEEMELLRSLHTLGFTRTRLIGIALQECATLASVLQLASNMVMGNENAKHVLILVFGRKQFGSRLAPGNSMIFSDGAVSAIVSQTAGNIEIVSTETLSNPYLASIEWNEENLGQYMEHGMALLREVALTTYKKNGITPADINMAFTTNSSLIGMEMAAVSTSLPSSAIYRNNLARYGHVFGCDSLLGLMHWMNEINQVKCTNLLLIGWAPYVSSICLLRFNMPK